MKTKFLPLLVLALSFNSWIGHTQTEIKLQPSDDAPKISKHIYGHFAEHLGRSIYDGFYVGDTSAIPNKDGVRTDIIEALKEIQIPNLRWPGGCFADTYQWKNGIGPQEERPTMVNAWWGGVTEDNSFGTHNFLNLCEELGAEPFISANVGSGTVQDFMDWIQYTNHPKGSPMAKLRKENGREEPWNVKYWGIGNEMWGCGGNMTVEYYTNIYKQYATFMGSGGNEDDLYRIAAGATGDDYHWTEVLMRDVPKSLIEAVGLHHYAVIDWEEKGPSTDYTEEIYFKSMKEALKMDEFVKKHIEVMEKHDPENEIDLVVDEWGGWYEVEEGTNPGFLYQQNTMRDAMIAGATLNIFNNHSDRVKMANIAQTVNVLQAVVLTEGEKMILTPTYHVFKMYTGHHDAQLLPVDFDSPEYSYEGESLPAISVSASKNEAGNTHISMVNLDANNEHKVEINLEGLDIKNMVGQILRSEKIQDHNTFDEPEKINIAEYKDFKLRKDKLEVNLPPFSVIVLSSK
ncbi:intracellular exo-alpha-L-arabinofuranosidase 2 [Salinimicrobium marinum]|uniref:non-reducing end alpha-L-arabinofuranosidase n=1 Tax=Salinimicrobium marinum TaxID=680283 RepID=A0A918S811_9FLAO|nr:alpha-L-arabinofuranosidase C-terminal domain-containing protein [Salinimicrobium marinum]GHA25717.1 intracellular exo-alpha-L-arabinofuranosidase 2 [Salinimicrobium marinum]